MPAADIPRFVGEGNIDLGITGQDMIAEAELNGLIDEKLPLNFGKCKLQVQVPERGPYQTAEQLVGRKVVTSFENVAKAYFAQLDAAAGPSSKPTVIEYISGSVEAACALGLGDGIVDLVGASRRVRARPDIAQSPARRCAQRACTPSRRCSSRKRC